MTPLQHLPATVARCVAPGAPEPLRLAVARGALPMPPVQQLCALAVLLADPAPPVRDAAGETWQALPAAALDGALDLADLPDEVLHLVATAPQAGEPRVFRVLGHPAAGPHALLPFCASERAGVLSRIADNQRALDRHPEVARRLLENSRLDPGERGRLEALYGAAAPAAERSAPPEGAGTPAPAEPEAEAPPAAPDGLPEELPEELWGEVDDGPEVLPSNLYQYVQSLSVADKVKLATVGGKGARKLLIRDTNKVVSSAVIRSPKIREDEVQIIAQDRTVSDEVVRIILTRKDWLKSYPIRLALAQNPKTPIPRALRLLDTLQERDLRQVSKSRNVASAISTGATRILARRGKL